MSWKESEVKAFMWFKSNIDPDATEIGEENSVVSDIYSPLYDAYIEVKDISNGARCGQFTESTIKNNPYAQAIYNGCADSNICRDFVKFHYNKKNVSYYIVVDGNDMKFYSAEEFFNSFNFEMQTPYAKRSGTRQAPKKDIPLLLELDSEFFVADDNKIYCSNENRKGEYFSLANPFDYFISKQSGELRKRSSTQNMTWHLLIKKI